MVIAVRTEHGPDGLAVVKEATTDEDRGRLRGEAVMLRRATHPGVVSLVSEGPGELRLRHAGTTLARLGPLAPDHAAGVVRAVADTLASLHHLAIAHRRVELDHVVIDDRGRPRLCGFAEAVERSPSAQADDVAALGRLLDQLLDAGEGLPWSAGHRGPRHAGQRRRAVRGFRRAADAAQRPDPDQRPTAKQFANALLDALPSIGLPAPPTPWRRPAGETAPGDASPTDPASPTAPWSADDLSFLAADDPADDPWPEASLAEPGPWDEGPDLEPFASEPVTDRPDRRVLAAAAAVLVLGVVVGSVLAREVRPLGGASNVASPTSQPPARLPVGQRESEPLAPSIPPATPAGCTAPSIPGPDLDGDDCPEPVELTDRVAAVGDARVELGQPGDLAVVADTDCDGEATPVLLRPVTGEVFVFRQWSVDRPIEVTASDIVPGATEITVGPGRCPTVVVTGDDVRRVVAGMAR